MATAMSSFSPIAQCHSSSSSFSLKRTQFLRYGKKQQQLHRKVFTTPNYQSTPSRCSAVSRDDSATTPELEEDAVEKRRREEEKFAVLNTGIYECRSCGYKYDESAGDPSYPIPPGFQFDKLPEDWRCPTCGAAQSFFESKMVEIAGFAQNQQYGLGGNQLTSGQKTALIFGSLFLFFLLFLSGYFIQ